MLEEIDRTWTRTDGALILQEGLQRELGMDVPQNLEDVGELATKIANETGKTVYAANISGPGVGKNYMTGYYLSAYHITTNPQNPMTKTASINIRRDHTFEPTNKVNPPQKKTYKGIEISGNKGSWEVVAFNKKFKTLKAARDYVNKQVNGGATSNGQCPRIIIGVRCKGTIMRSKTNWKCKSCNAQFREA